MCSILALLDLHSDPAPLRARALRLSRLQRHRGPDRSGIYATDRAVLAHERLAIVDVTHGAQPLLSRKFRSHNRGNLMQCMRLPLILDHLVPM